MYTGHTKKTGLFGNFFPKCLTPPFGNLSFKEIIGQFFENKIVCFFIVILVDHHRGSFSSVGKSVVLITNLISNSWNIYLKHIIDNSISSLSDLLQIGSQASFLEGLTIGAAETVVLHTR